MPKSPEAPLAPVIVIDLQTGLFDGVFEPPLHGAAEIEANARAVLAWARRAGRPVAFIRHDGDPSDPSLAPGKPGWPVWPAIGQAEGEPTFSKSVGDAFSNPALGAWVGDADEVILLGAQSDHCVAATVKGALGRGLAVTVVEDAHSTMDTAEATAAEIIARENRAFAEAGVRLTPAAALTAD
jgi:nicotinamidase-related amidase